MWYLCVPACIWINRIDSFFDAYVSGVSFLCVGKCLFFFSLLPNIELGLFVGVTWLICGTKEVWNNLKTLDCRSIVWDWYNSRSPSFFNSTFTFGIAHSSMINSARTREDRSQCLQ
jgi:hypothetical protein